MFINFDLLVSQGEIDFRDELRLANTIKTVLNSWQRISVLLRNIIQEAVVDTYSLPGPFRDEENWKAPCARGESN